MRLRGVALLTAALVFTAAPALGQPSGAQESARKLFEEGKELEDKSDFAGALAKYKEAEALFATPGVVFHKGFCLEMTGKLLPAVDTYEKAIAAARNANKPEVEKATSARLEPLRARIPQLIVRLATKADGVAMQLDGAPLDKPTIDGKPLRIEPGAHDLTATAPAHRSFAKQLRAQEGSTVTVDVALEALPARGTDPVEPPREAKKSGSITLPLVATVGAVVFAGGGVVAFLLAGNAASDADAECPAKLSCDNERTNVRVLDAVALTGFVGGFALGALSVVLWVTRPSPTGRGPSTRFVAAPGSVGLQGSF